MGHTTLISFFRCLLFTTDSVKKSETLAVLKAQVSLELGKVFSSDNGVSVSIVYSYCLIRFYLLACMSAL